MARGSSLFTSLFDDIEMPVQTRQRKGRSDEHNDRRNECLLARYYFYGKFGRFEGTTSRYPQIIRMLSNEFYLTERTIQDIIQEETVILHRLRETKPQPSWFKKEWPHLVWIN